MELCKLMYCFFFGGLMIFGVDSLVRAALVLGGGGFVCCRSSIEKLTWFYNKHTKQ